MKNLFTARMSAKKGWLIFYVMVTLFSIVIPHLFSFKNDEIVLNISYVEHSESTEKFVREVDNSYVLPEQIDQDAVSVEELMSYGLSQSVSEAWVNFRTHIGTFKNKEQVRKVYGMTDSIFNKIEPLLSFSKPEAKKKDRKNYESNRNSRIYKKFAIDPNSVSLDSLLKTGLDEQVAHTMIKFRNAGAEYRSIEDLKKVYNMDANWLEGMEAFFDFPSQSVSSSTQGSKIKEKYKSKERVINSIELNHATVEDLDRLPGIGPSYASRIVKYRELLGGYSSHVQLSEVYGLPDSVITKIVPYLLLTAGIEQRIDVNSAPLDTLAAHPYISYKQAKVIIAYRNQHGNYHTIDDLKKVMILSDEWIEKVRGYLDF